MKKYIRCYTVQELEDKLAKAKEKEAIHALIEPVADRVLRKFRESTGFQPRIQKYYYARQFDAVLLEIGQYYNWGLLYLSSYINPGRARPNNPAMISLSASDEEVSEYVDRLIEGLIGAIKHTFDSEYTVDRENNLSYNHIEGVVGSDDWVIKKILREANIYDRSTAEKFIRSLLSSGQVVNKLSQYL